MTEDVNISRVDIFRKYEYDMYLHVMPSLVTKAL